MRFLALMLMAIAASVSETGAVECSDVTFDGAPFSVCAVDTSTEDLRLFLKDDDGDLIGQFSILSEELAKTNKTLAFAMNAGMYHADRAPVGHYVEGGVEEMRLIRSAGPGNFGLLPNGVFCIASGRADVIETERFARTAPECRDASQSGPMLVIDGALHPRFLEDGTSRYIRNGVGTNASGTRAFFAVSNVPVNFHHFGRFFRDFLSTPQALYFDGNISRLFAPELGRNDPGFTMGPIVGVVIDR